MSRFANGFKGSFMGVFAASFMVGLVAFYQVFLG
jgi:hypothetical protein